MCHTTVTGTSHPKQVYKRWKRRRREWSIAFDGGATPHDRDGTLTCHAALGRVKGFTGNWLISSWWLTKEEKMYTRSHARVPRSATETQQTSITHTWGSRPSSSTGIKACLITHSWIASVICGTTEEEKRPAWLAHPTGINWGKHTLCDNKPQSKRWENNKNRTQPKTETQWNLDVSFCV